MPRNLNEIVLYVHEFGFKTHIKEHSIPMLPVCNLKYLISANLLWPGTSNGYENNFEDLVLK
jgi:hypothetical protein